MSKYLRTLRTADGELNVDVYDVLEAFGVTCPALQHLLKKGLCAGLRGHKNQTEDLLDILASAKRALELHHVHHQPDDTDLRYAR